MELEIMTFVISVPIPIPTLRFQCRGLQMAKYFVVMLNIFEFSHMEEIAESWLVYKFSGIIQPSSLIETINWS